MKILYGIQCTGNGHLTRAVDIIKELKKYAEVEVLISGNQFDLEIPFPITYKKNGISFISGKFGSPNIFKSIKNLQIRKFAQDIKALPVENYDLIISDYEPITAWASYFKNKVCIGLSNQVSFFSKKAPRPKRKNILIEYLLKNFAPTSKKIGFHYESYDEFIETPIISSEIRESVITDKGHIVVYLPTYDLEKLSYYFKQIPEIEWHIFSRYTKNNIKDENIIIKPIGKEYIKSLTSAHGLICAAGFQATAEALYLGKKLLVIPHRFHYEQACNAAALHELGITTLKKVDANFAEKIKDWLFNKPIFKINYPDNAEKVAKKIIHAYKKQKQPIKAT